MTPSQLAAAIAAKFNSKLSDAEVFLLCMLATHGRLRPRTIVNTLHITPAGVNTAAKKLISRKLISKLRDDSGDERSVRYTIEPRGRRVVELITESKPPVIA